MDKLAKLDTVSLAMAIFQTGGLNLPSMNDSRWKLRSQAKKSERVMEIIANQAGALHTVLDAVVRIATITDDIARRRHENDHSITMMDLQEIETKIRIKKGQLECEGLEIDIEDARYNLNQKKREQ